MADYKVVCGDKKTLDIYNTIKADGASDKKLDNGYFVFSRAEDGKVSPRRVGAGDKTVTCEEINEYTADNRPDLLKLLAGRDDPLLLDSETKEKWAFVIGMIRDGLIKNGIKPLSDDYKEKMALALYFYAYLPEAKLLKYWQERAPYILDPSLRGSLVRSGMEDFKNWIIENGGVGLSRYADDKSMELTAAEAIKERTGMCTEKAKIFYAMLKMAGLSPYMSLMTGKDLIQAWNRSAFAGKALMKLAPEEEFNGHVVATLDVGGKPWFFEFNLSGFLPVWNAPYSEIAWPVTLREFYQAELLNLSVSYQIQGDSNGAKYVWWAANNMGDSTAKPDILTHAAALVIDLGGATSAVLANLEGSLKIDPLDEHTKKLYCKTLSKAGRVQDAIGCFDDIKSKISSADSALGEAYFDNERPKEAREAFLRVIEKEPSNGVWAKNYIGRTYLMESNFVEAETWFRKVIEDKPLAAVFHYNLGIALKGQQRKDEAIQSFKRSLVLDPASEETYGFLLPLLISQGRTLEAQVYLEAVEFNVSDLKLLFDLGKIYLDSGKFDKAVICYDRAAEIFTRRKETPLDVVVCWLISRWKAGQDITPALDHLKLAGHADFGSNMPIWLKVVEEYFKDIPPDLLQLPEVKETVATIYSKLGDAAHEQNQPDIAEKFYKRARALRPADNGTGE